MPTSRMQKPTRLFVCVLHRLAKVHKLCITVGRDSDDTTLSTAFKAVARRAQAHPDKGGSDEDMSVLLSAKEAFEKSQGSAVSAHRQCSQMFAMKQSTP